MPSSPRFLMGFTNSETGVFKNWAKAGFSLRGQLTGTPYPALVNADAYPVNGAVFTSNYTMKVGIPQDVTTSDDLVMKLTNVGGAAGGDIALARGAPGFDNIVVTSGTQVGTAGSNLTMKGTNPRVVFRFATSVPTAEIDFNFNAGGTFSGCSNLVICKLSDEAAIDAATTPEELFYQSYVDFYTTLNCKVFRPMGWANTNGNNNSRYAYRTPWRTALTYYSQRWDPGAWAGTVSGTDTYTCGASPDTTALSDGATIQVFFTNANTGTSATLNFNGTGAKSILTNEGNPSLGIGSIFAGTPATLVFDSLLNGWMYDVNGFTYSTMPVEVRVAFANKCGVDYWHNTPAWYDDASIVSEATYIRDNLAAGKNAYFEFSNETWNFSFTQSHWIYARGLALGFPTTALRNMRGYIGLRLAQFLPKIAAIWGSRGGLRGVNAVQVGASPTDVQTYQFDGADLNTSLGYAGYNSFVGVNYNTFPNRPGDSTIVISPADYILGAQCVQFDQSYTFWFSQGLNINGLTTAADDYDSGDAKRMATALLWLDNDIRQGLMSNGVLGDSTMKGFLLGSPGVSPLYAAWNTLAASYTPPKDVEYYEGCTISCAAPSTATCTAIGISTMYGGSTGKIQNLITAYKSSPLARQIVIDQKNELMTYSRSRTPAWLLIPGDGGIWGVTPANIYSTKFQSYYGIYDFNHATFGRLR